jgi:hypothetical protein
MCVCIFIYAHALIYIYLSVMCPFPLPLPRNKKIRPFVLKWKGRGITAAIRVTHWQLTVVETTTGLASCGAPL